MKARIGDRVFGATNAALLGLFGMLCLLPFLSVIGTSLTSEEEWVRRGAYVLIPERPVLDAYRMLLATRNLVFQGMWVSIMRVLVGTSLNLLFTITLAYALSKRFLGQTGLTFFAFLTMIFSGGLIPTYMLMQKLGLINSFWSMVFPGLVNVWWMFIMRNFFAEIPEDYEEAATIDGASFWHILVRIVVPLSMASIATIGLFYAVHHWNEWFGPFLYVNKPSLLPLQNRLRAILVRGLSDNPEAQEAFNEFPPAQTLKTAMIIITTVPILVVYPFVQKYFVKGVRMGGVKG